MRFRPSHPLLVCAVIALAGCASQSQKPSTPGSQSQSKPQSSTSSSDSSTPSKPTASSAIPPPAPASSPAPGSAAPQSPSAEKQDPARTASTSGGSAGRAQTPDERRAAIDRRLDGSLGTFDETLRKEQKAVAEEKDAREASAAGSASSEQAESSRAGDEASGSAKPESPPAESAESGRKGNGPSRPGDLKSDKDRAAGNGGPQGSGTGAGEIPDGSDDDIVARRLRKAAEQETDPELKEKLWKEYVDYKKNAGT